MSDDEDFGLNFKPIVLVTGFGPYLDVPVNPSWEAVQLLHLQRDVIEDRHNIELVLLELPVTYEHVDEFVPQLWETHTPKLVIHVGVSRLANCLVLETQAHKKGYKHQDYLSKCPANHVCLADGAMRIQTKFNVDKICQDFNENSPSKEISAEVSYDAGRYLCEYIYYTSLSVDSTRTLFVHVPNMDTYSSEKTAQGLETILDLCLQQVNENDRKTKDITKKMNDVTLNNTVEA